MKTNAKTEFLAEVEDMSPVIAAVVSRLNHTVTGSLELRAELPLGYTESDYQDFLTALDFSYDSGFGGQELFGTIWLQDGSWFDRAEYDGSEWWSYMSRPGIPSNLHKAPGVQ